MSSVRLHTQSQDYQDRFGLGLSQKGKKTGPNRTFKHYSCPPPDVTTDDPMALDSPAHPSPKIVISVSEIPESIAAESAVPLDEGGLSEGHTQLGS